MNLTQLEKINDEYNYLTLLTYYTLSLSFPFQMNLNDYVPPEVSPDVPRPRMSISDA